MDIATIIGLIAGSGLVLWGMLSGASLEMFVDYPSVAIVLGGASATALISFPLKDVFKIAKVVKHTILFKTRDKSELIKELVHYAEVARRDGVDPHTMQTELARERPAER